MDRLLVFRLMFQKNIEKVWDIAKIRKIKAKTTKSQHFSMLKFFRWTQLLCQKILIYFLSCLLQPCFGNEKFTKEFYFLYQVASERRALRLLSKALESTPTITNYITVDIFVRRCPRNMSWFSKRFFNLFQLH